MNITIKYNTYFLSMMICLMLVELEIPDAIFYVKLPLLGWIYYNVTVLKYSLREIYFHLI